VARILLVEDDANILSIWKDALLAANYEVDSAETAQDGCALIACRPYDLVISDGRLRDGTGMMVAGFARAKDIPAIIVTGYSFIFEELRGDQNVLLKPLRPSELVEAVAKSLGRT
jgi:DNA-binding response OmpR family regulator